MNDPWADVRHLSEKRPRGPWGTIAQVEVERLLTDADSLLKVVRTGEAYKRIELGSDKTQQEQYFLEMETRREFWAALADLPEHLK